MSEPTTQTPAGWFIAGSVRAAYVAGVDPRVAMGDGPSGYLKSTRRKIDGFGTLMQDINGRWRDLRVYSALATDPAFRRDR